MIVRVKELSELPTCRSCDVLKKIFAVSTSTASLQRKPNAVHSASWTLARDIT